jgi:hypothetical protein
MALLSALECAERTHVAISRIGGGFMVSPSVSVAAQRLDLSFLEFYIVGRAGVLGRVSSDRVAQQLALLNPDMVAQQWNSAIAKVDPHDGARAYAECCREWGSRRLTDAAVVARAVPLVERLVAALPVQDLALVAGWRALAQPGDTSSRLTHLLNTLREFRGALHARAVGHCGLDPVEAIVAGPDGPQRAGQLGWPPPYPDPAPYAGRWAQAEALTNEWASQPYRVLDEAQREQLVEAAGLLLECLASGSVRTA